MSEPPDRRIDRRNGLLAVAVYLFASLAWMVVVGVTTAGGIIGWSWLVGADPLAILASEHPAAALPAWLIGLSTLLQFAGMLGIALGEVYWFGWQPYAAFATMPPAATPLAAGLIGGLVVGILPGWIAGKVTELFPIFDHGNLEMIDGLLTRGPLAGRAVMVLAVCVAAPIVEELVFRGFLFEAVERAATPVVAWLATSLMFAGYHADPVHVVAVLFTGLFLGGLRLSSGSVWPGVAAHAVNNTLATSMALWFGGQTAPEAAIPWWGALIAGGITVAIGIGAHLSARASR